MDPIKVWINMDDTFASRMLLRIAFFAKYLKAKRIAKWCINRIATKHINAKLPSRLERSE